MRIRTALLFLSLSIALAARAQTLVDIVNDATDPMNLEDSEPSIAVNPLNANEISVIAFPNAWSAAVNAPVWKSRDGGMTWTPVPQLPQPGAGSFASNDQKITYLADGRLLIVEIGAGLPNPACFFYRQTGAADAALTPGMAYGDDQPHVASDNTAASPFFNRAYSPWLDFSVANPHSTVARTTDDGVNVMSVGAGDNSMFANRTTRVAVGLDGAVYIVYKTREGAVDANFETAHFRVNRSDDGGVTWTGAGGAAGVSVHGPAAVTTWFTTAFGNAAKGKVGRARSSDAWISVNPGNGDIWVAYCNRDASTFGQIFAVRSTDHGITWSAPARVTDGTHNAAYPEIAVTSSGVVGVLYIDYDDSGAAISFRHHFAKSADNGATWSDVILQAMDPTPFANARPSFIWGDYEGLTAAGHTFYGVFTGAGIGRSTPQLDPIFFKVSATASDKDFYVRDWTDTAASGDNGAEPSTHPVFYATSDVWNLRSNVAPTFNANNQPNHETPNNGGGSPNNYMFTRVFRNTAGAAQDVRARFYYSEFGTGSNYQVAGAAAPDTVSFGAGITSVVSGAHPWTLPTTVSNHLCMLVEIDTDDDPIQPPSLLGRAPGWPTSDLNVLNDNNKAQRNTEVNHESGDSATSSESYAIVHNPGFEPHDFVLDYRVTAGEAVLREIGGNGRARGKEGTLRIARVLPGENRWVGLTLQHAAGGPAAVNIAQIEDGRPVNGFEIRVEPAPDNVVIAENLDARRIVFQRLGATLRNDAATAHAKRIAAVMKRSPSFEQYLALIRSSDAVLNSLGPAVQRELFDASPFGLGDALQRLRDAVKSGRAPDVLAADAAFLHKADAQITKFQKDRGDAADIAQMTEWQSRLLQKYGRYPCAERLLKPVERQSYATTVRALAGCAATISGTQPPKPFPTMQALERLQRETLLRLAGEVTP
jgi:hypothetical protein